MIQKIEALLSARRIGALNSAEYNSTKNRLFDVNKAEVRGLRTQVRDLSGLLVASKNECVIRRLEELIENVRGEIHEMEQAREKAEERSEEQLFNDMVT